MRPISRRIIRRCAAALSLMSACSVADLNATFVDQRIFDMRQAIYDGKCQHAIALATHHLESSPNDEDALRILGSAHFLLKDYPSAITVWRRALGIEPKDLHVIAFLEVAVAVQDVGKKPTRELIRDLGSAKRAERLNAEVRLSAAMPDVLPELVASATHTPVAIRLGIAGVLGEFRGPTATIRRQIIPALTNALADKDPGVRAKASDSLGRLGIADARAINALNERLKDSSAEVRKAATQAMSLIQQSETAGRHRDDSFCRGE